jgi:hypothetical protein
MDAANKNIVEEIANDSLKSVESCSRTTELDASAKNKVVKMNCKYLWVINLRIDIHKYSHAKDPIKA